MLPVSLRLGLILKDHTALQSATTQRHKGRMGVNWSTNMKHVFIRFATCKGLWNALKILIRSIPASVAQSKLAHACVLLLFRAKLSSVRHGAQANHLKMLLGTRQVGV